MADDLEGYWHDLALVTLERSAPASADRYELYREDDEVGQLAFLTGYGEGMYPYGTPKNDPQPTLREGLNTVDATAEPMSARGWKGSLEDQLVFDYDDGTIRNDTLGNILGETHLGVGEYEAMLTPGDSGGGLFLADEDDWLLAGIHTFISGDQPVGTVGDIGVSTRISSYTDWIDQSTGVVQEPEARSTEPPSRDSVPMEVSEGEGVWFMVELGSPASREVSVDFYTRDGTAEAGYDVTLQGGMPICLSVRRVMPPHISLKLFAACAHKA